MHVLFLEKTYMYVFFFIIYFLDLLVIDQIKAYKWPCNCYWKQTINF